MHLTVPRGGINETVLDRNISAQRFHAFDVLVNRPFTEVAAAGHRRLRNAESAEHGADEIIGRADLAHQIKRSITEGDMRAVNING